MSVIHVKQIAAKVSELFKDYIDRSDLNSSDKELESKILTRCLAAYAIYTYSGCSIEDAASSIVDGGDDNGIDAIYYSPSLRQLFIVQSKWIKSGIGEPDSGEVSKFCRGVKDLFNSDFDRFNKKINNKRTIIEHALSEYDTRYNLVLIDTGDRGLAEHSQRQIDDLLAEMNDAGEGVTDEIVNFDRMNQSTVYSSLALSIGNAPINVEIGLSQWGKLSEPQPAFFGIISGEELAKLWGDHGRRLFDRNIRQVLGLTDVNDEIKHTLVNKPDKFWYFNNGVTIVAEKIDKSMVGGSGREFGTFKLSAASVVNGAQTVSTIGKFHEESGKGLEQVKVQLRLISLSDAPEEFGNEVTRTNNRQNRIENRDFVSQDPEQIRIKTELAIDGVDYNIVRSDSFKPGDKSFDLQEATVSLACSSGQPSLAVQAKREIGRFYEDLSKSPYKTIFNPATSGLRVFNSVIMTRAIDDMLSDQISKLPKKSGREYGLLIHGNRMIALIVMRELSFNSVADKQEFEVDIKRVTDTTVSVISRIQSYLDDHYPDNMLGTLFKNATKCKDIYDHA